MKIKVRSIIFWLIFMIVFLLHAVINGACDWYNMRFGVSFEEILFTITSPLVGADVSFLGEAVEYTIPYVIKAIPPMIILMVATLIFYKIVIVIKIKIAKRSFKASMKSVYKFSCMALAILMLISSLTYTVNSLALDDYILRKLQPTTIYEEQYVDPNSVTISCEGEPKNLIYIYLESMETTYASVADGGMQEVNYIPKLTQLANENISFSDTEILGGAHVAYGATWTMGALFATTTGIPFAFPIEGNSMGSMGTFASGVTSLGDLLNQYGYTQKFLCGSDGTFGGRKAYFEQHGGYDVLDYAYAVGQGYIPSGYYVWWGYEDAKLFDIAKTELLNLSTQDAPFNFTMLTVDAHHVDGYVCQNCNNTYSHQLGNVLECTDQQVYDFILWCQQQDFYEDTVIVISGDHYRMDSSLVAEASELGKRRLYNCILNADIPAESGTQNRLFTSLDLFPTTLSAMGFDIEGDRLGLGTNLFSSTPTLAEEMGIDEFKEEISKYSEFYIENFE